MNQSGNRATEMLHRDPPTSIFSSFRFLGPGLILSAAIVGSGELIATTALGARAGFALLWIILLGCLIKVAVQVEYGRYCILYGRPSFQAWNSVTRGKVLGLHWTVWIAFLFMISMFIGLAGVLGGAGQVVLHLFPSVSLEVWILLLALLSALLVFHGRYRAVEIIATGLNLMFVVAVGFCVIGVQKTGYAFGWADLADGFSPNVPIGALSLAIGAFGITGVGAAEIFTYPYWCLEKGYALWCGPSDGSKEWRARAKGWTRVMMLDAFTAMVIYTLTTCAFYVLGASVLRPQASLADGNELVLQLSAIFTEVLGPQAMLVFMLGAFAVLFSTVFANTAGYARLWTDLFVVSGVVKIKNERTRLKSIAWMAWFLPFSWAFVYLTVQKPLFLIVFMGVSNAVFLLVVAYKAIVFRFCQSEEKLATSRWYDLFLCVSVISIGIIACWALYSTFVS